MNLEKTPKQKSLSSTAARGGVITLGSQGVRVALQLVGTIALARLLGPTDFGLIAMVLVFVGLGEVVRDFGLSNAAIQARVLSIGERNALFWLNTAIGAVLAILLFFLAVPISLLFGQPELVPLVQWLSPIVLLHGMATQYQANLTRDMRFLAITAADLISLTVGLAVGIGAAMAGVGVFSLVLQQLASAVLGLVIVVILGHWLPRLPRRGVSIRPFVRYGWNLFLAEMLIYSSKNIDTVVIGLTSTPAALGLYNRAYQLLMVPIMQINAPLKRVALPTLSKLQDAPQRYSAYLLRAQKILVLAVLVILGFGASQALPLIGFVLGSDWLGAVPIFQILAVGGAFHVVTYAVAWVFLSRGITGSYFRYTLVTRSVMIGLVVLGSLWGVIGVAAGYSLALALQWPVALLWTRRVEGVPTKQMLGTGVRALVIVGVASAPGLVISTWLQPWGTLVDFLAGTGIMLVLLAAAFLVWPRARADLREVVDGIARIRGGRAKAGSDGRAGAATAEPDGDSDPADAEPAEKTEQMKASESTEVQERVQG